MKNVAFMFYHIITMYGFAEWISADIIWKLPDTFPTFNDESYKPALDYSTLVCIVLIYTELLHVIFILN